MLIACVSSIWSIICGPVRPRVGYRCVAGRCCCGAISVSKNGTRAGIGVSGTLGSVVVRGTLGGVVVSGTLGGATFCTVGNSGVGCSSVVTSVVSVGCSFAAVLKISDSDFSAVRWFGFNAVCKIGLGAFSAFTKSFAAMNNLSAVVAIGVLVPCGKNCAVALIRVRPVDGMKNL